MFETPPDAVERVKERPENLILGSGDMYKARTGISHIDFVFELGIFKLGQVENEDFEAYLEHSDQLEFL